MTEMIKPAPLTTSIEESDPTWLCERWERLLEINYSPEWFKMGNIMHCCAMAIWEINSTQRMEYLVLSSLADAHGIAIEEKRKLA